MVVRLTNFTSVNGDMSMMQHGSTNTTPESERQPRWCVRVGASRISKSESRIAGLSVTLQPAWTAWSELGFLGFSNCNLSGSSLPPEWAQQGAFPNLSYFIAQDTRPAGLLGISCLVWHATSC